MNIENCRTWLSYLKKAYAEQPALRCNMLSTESTCGSPGCIVGLTYQLMEPILRPFLPDKHKNLTWYSFVHHLRALLTYLGIGNDFYTKDLGEEWMRMFNVSTFAVFSAQAAYGVRSSRPVELVPLGTVITRWEQFVNRMEAKLAV